MAELPEFENPPVKEVVCGILFEPLEPLLAPHLGLLWQEFRKEYPQCEQKPPLAPLVEHLDESQRPQEEVSFPFFPRVWFVHASQSGVIQVQKDRFLHNWRRAKTDDEYPRYKNVIKMFRERLAVFSGFIDKHSLGAILPKQFEITYVNEIPRGANWEHLVQIADVFPDFSWRRSKERYLHDLEAVNFTMAFRLPDKSGRLHATVRSTRRREDLKEVLLLDLTCRGIPLSDPLERMWEWFDMAHEWIVRSFADLTSAEIQASVWRRSR